jgi:phosphoserine aminotransferase
MIMSRVYNFSAGPAVLPEEVLKEAADEMLDYQGSGMSVMEMSHRSKVYDNIIKEAEQDLRDIADVMEGTYEYSVDEQVLTLTEMEYGSQKTFVREED